MKRKLLWFPRTFIAIPCQYIGNVFVTIGMIFYSIFQGINQPYLELKHEEIRSKFHNHKEAT